MSEYLGNLRYCHRYLIWIWLQNNPYRPDYRNDPKFSDRYAGAKSADPDQTAPLKVYTVCHSVCILRTHYSMVEPHSSNFRVIKTNFLGVRIFRKFTIGCLLVQVYYACAFSLFFPDRFKKRAGSLTLPIIWAFSLAKMRVLVKASRT